VAHEPHPLAEQDRQLQAALTAVEASRDRPYYDAEADQSARERYYEGIDAADGTALRSALAALLERTHEPRPAYNPATMVYPWVDLHPDRLLQGIYSGKSFTPEELIRADLAIEAERTEHLQRLIAHGYAVGPAEYDAEFDALEAELPFNCEHVVCQSWFAKREPMRGDLHHLFTCDSHCNSFRGNTPYIDFPDTRDATLTDCGHRDAAGFEPAAGKGKVARATLYFLLRYPGKISSEPREVLRERLTLLLDWHRASPVDAHERHRNAAIAAVQHNRNPLIDHPEWADRIDFAAGFDS
jgi:endonuclease G